MLNTRKIVMAVVAISLISFYLVIDTFYKNEKQTSSSIIRNSLDTNLYINYDTAIYAKMLKLEKKFKSIPSYCEANGKVYFYVFDKTKNKYGLIDEEVLQ